MRTDLPVNRFKRALAEKRRQIGLWLTLTSPVATEIAAGAGFDWLVLSTSPTIGIATSRIAGSASASAIRRSISR